MNLHREYWKRPHRQLVKRFKSTSLIYLFCNTVLLGLIFKPNRVLAQTVTYENTGSAIIPAGGCLEQTFNVSENFTLDNVDLGFNANHASSRDFIRVELTHPDGTSVVLIYSVIRGSDGTRTAAKDYDVFLDDSATNNPYNRSFVITQPFYDLSAVPIDLSGSGSSELLSTFDGKSSQGTWTLEVCNTSTTNTGTYNRSNLVLSDAEPAVNVPVASNLDYTVGCETDTKLAIVLDASGSVDANEAQLTREATQALIEEFSDTGTEIGIVEFAQTARLQVNFTEVNSTSITNTFTSYLNNTYPDRNFVGFYTNWEAGLQTTYDELTDADAVIFITDGNPNTYLNEDIGNTPITDVDDGFLPVNEAISAANTIKNNGTHIYAFGITDAVNIDTLLQIAEGESSIQFNGANAIFADYEFLSNFTTNVLAKSLTNFAQGVCDSNRPRLRLVKRITAIYSQQSSQSSQTFTSFVDDPNTEDDNYPYWPDGDDIYLPGEINVNDLVPGDEVEYTIYFLSSGGTNAKQTKFCDVIPDNMSFSENSYREKAGIALGLESSSPAITEKFLTNTEDMDEGKFSAPETILPIGLCQKVDSNGNTVEVNTNNNENGAIVIDIDSLPSATAPGYPGNSYGFIRFRAKIQ